MPSPKAITSYLNVWIWLDIILFAIITSGNILTILAIGMSRRLRTVRSNYFILNLAVADLFVGFSLPYHIVFYASEYFGDFPITCLLRFVVMGFAGAASMYNLIIVAIDRYISVVHPLKYEKYMTRWVIIIMIAFGWIHAALFSLIPLFWNCFDPDDPCEMDYVLPR